MMSLGKVTPYLTEETPHQRTAGQGDSPCGPEGTPPPTGSRQPDQQSPLAPAHHPRQGPRGAPAA